MTAIAFCCGLALGVIVGASLWSGALYAARLALAAAHRKQIAEFRQQAVQQQKRMQQVRADLKAHFGDEMTREQERIMESELAKVFTERPNPGIRE